MIRLAVPALILAAGGCAEEPSAPLPEQVSQAEALDDAGVPEPREGPVVPAPPPVALPVLSIEGDWTLAAIDGEALPPAAQVILNIGPDRIDFQNCQQVNWGYKLNDGNLVTERRPAITVDIRPKPLPCAAPFTPPVQEMVRRLDTASRVDPAANGAIRVRAEGGSITLAPVRAR